MGMYVKGDMFSTALNVICLLYTSSMGGLMSLYGVMEFNHVFSRAGALSPSVWVAPGKLSKLAREAELGRDTVIYTDYGSEEDVYKRQPLYS